MLQSQTLPRRRAFYATPTARGGRHQPFQRRQPTHVHILCRASGDDCVPATVLIAPALNFLQSRWAHLSPEERERWKNTGRLRVTNQWVDEEIGYGIVEEIDKYQVEMLAAAWNKPLLIFHGMED